MEVKCNFCNDTGTVEMYGFKDECVCKTPKKGKNITYLEVYVNGTLHKRHDITNESEHKVDAYCKNAIMLKTVELHELITDRLLPVGKINSLV
jgi:hypothetical protein